MDTSWFNKGLRIHLAGYYNGKAFAYELADQYPWFLESYHYVGKGTRSTDKIRYDGIKIFLASGAFSMLTKGIEVNMQEYVDFIKNNKDIIEVASVLDSIGDPQLTLDNQKTLEDMGVDILPCFHYGEPVKYLEYYLENYKYITIGGMVPISTPQLKIWLDQIWDNYLTDTNGWPIVKVHGFGLTALSLIERYPWFSVDYTIWVLASKFGSIFYPTPSKPEGKLVISNRSPKIKTDDMHYRTLSPSQRKSIDSRFKRLGYTSEELSSIYWKRDLYNVGFFKELTDTPVKPFVLREQGLF